jgi:hypothetical protein
MVGTMANEVDLPSLRSGDSDAALLLDPEREPLRSTKAHNLNAGVFPGKPQAFQLEDLSTDLICLHQDPLFFTISISVTLISIFCITL